MRDQMKEKLIAVKERINSFNGRRNENSRKYKMTNLLLTVLFPVFIVCMAEINQAKKPLNLYFSSLKDRR